MAEYLLTITPYNKNPFDVKLSDSATDSVDEKHFLRSDFTYRLNLKIGGAQKTSVYVNGERVKDFRGSEANCDRIFTDCYGFAQLSFIVYLDDGRAVTLHSEYLPVLVKNIPLNNSVRAMVNYVYENCEEFLFDGDLKSRARASRKKSNVKTLAERLKLAENIAAAYEKNYSYFKANCRFKTEKVPALDGFEKLQQLTAPTLQHIATHPENLAQVKSSVGVRIGGRIFQPLKTLTFKNIRSRDTYENRAVLKFLQKISDDLTVLHDDYERQNFSKNLLHEEDYLDPAQYLLNWSSSTLAKISSLREKFQRLLKLYKDALQIPLPTNFLAPQPTPIFLSVPQYNQIFLGLHEWLKFGACDFAQEDFIFELAKSWNLYEKYLLLKFIAYLRANDYKLIEKFHMKYPLPTNALYEHTDIINIFVLEGAAAKITLYYQPVIYIAPKKIRNAPALYRNNSAFGDGEGIYYVPDFVVQIETDSGDIFSDSGATQYLIIDAKFSSYQTVREKYLRDFILKYTVSVSCANADDKITGYSLVYGKCDAGNKPESLYHNKFKKTSPSFEIVPLMENISNENLSLYKILAL